MDNILKTARRKKGLTQAQVAAALGRDQSTVSKYETGAARPDAAIAPAYATLLGIGVLDVLYPEQQPTREVA